MARRRLSDLLREEANKPSDDLTAAAAAEQSAEEPDAAEANGAGETATIAPSASTKASTATKGRATKQTEPAAPETTPNQNQDEALLQKIADLTLALDAQKETIEQLRADLEQTRKDARQLADSNAALTQELKTLQAKKVETDTSALEKKAESRPYQELRLSSPPIAPTSNPPNSFNKDVGWFD